MKCHRCKSREQGPDALTKGLCLKCWTLQGMTAAIESKSVEMPKPVSFAMPQGLDECASCHGVGIHALGCTGGAVQSDDIGGLTIPMEFMGWFGPINGVTSSDESWWGPVAEFAQPCPGAPLGEPAALRRIGRWFDKAIDALGLTPTWGKP